MNTFNLGWLVGLLEGEGCFGAYTSNRAKAPRYFYPHVQLTMTDEQIVRRVARLIGAPSVRTHRDKRPNCQPHWVCAVTGPKAVKLMTKLLPYMGKRQKTRIRKAISLWNGRQTTTSRRA